MDGIKNIIFDLGGVIIDLDFNRTRNAFIDLGFAEFDLLYSKSQQDGVFDAFDKGTVTPEEFRDHIRKHIRTEISDAEIDSAWNAMLLNVSAEKLEVLSRLKKTHRTFLLSNTNVIHVKSFSDYLLRIYGFSDFTRHFEKCYYSCDIGMRKPDAEIFEHVLHLHDLNPAETLFIDDSAQHIEGAGKCGIRTMLHTQNAPLPAVFGTLV